MSESKNELPRIKLAIGGMPDTRIFRNQVGVAFVGQPPNLTRVKTGLCVGSADLIGWHEYVIQWEDIGRKVAVFTSVEVKAVGARTEPGHLARQTNWAEAIRTAGGIAFFSTDPAEAVQEIRNWRP